MNDEPSPLLEMPPVTGYQGRSIFSPAKYVIIEAGTKTGKTLGNIWWLVTQAGNAGKGHREWWWVAPIREQARVAFDRTKSLFVDNDPTKIIHRDIHETSKSIELQNGGVLRFKSGDEPDHLFGDDVYGAVIDEASRVKEDAWYAVRSTITATGGKLRIIGNIKGRHNWAYQLARRVEAGNLPGWEYYSFTAYDAIKANVLSTEQVDEARQVLPDHVFKELYENIPSEDGSNPFGLGHIAACVGDLGAEPVACYGLDLARAVDWTVLVGLDNSGRVVQFERWQHVPWSDTIARLVHFIGDAQCLADATGVGDAVVPEIQRQCPCVEGFKFSQTSKQDLMQGLAVAIQQRRVMFPNGPIRMELESFEYAVTRTSARYSAPEGLNDDCVMALALAVKKLGTRGTVELVGGPKQVSFSLPVPSVRSLDSLREDPEWAWIPV